MDKLTSSQISEWQAYDRIDPIGKWRDDFYMASLSSLIVNIVKSLYGKKGETVQMTRPLDFMPDWSGEIQKGQQKQRTEDMKRMLTGFFKGLNKKKKEVNDTRPPKLRKR